MTTNESASVESATNASAPKPKWPTWKRWLFGVAACFVGASILGGGAVGIAEHHTSQPDFCASCHIMGPYYDTWHDDIHGSKLDIACVECHYAPGERTTLKAKFRGLSQAASYFSGRYGSSRPRAHVSNASCMTAKCHGDERFMDKELTLGTVTFTHSQHLNPLDEREAPHQERLAELEKLLKEQVGEEVFADLERVATQAGPAAERYDELATLAKKSNSETSRDDLVEFSQLHHRTVRIDQLRSLQCTNCHSYQATDHKSDGHGQHFQVSMTTCYTCHFNNEGFNTGTNTCLSCHSPPQQEIVVHASVNASSEKVEESQLDTRTVRMNHADLLARKVDCYSCHADTAGRDSTVTRRDCERCHDQPRFFTDWQEPFTLDLVSKYHDVHVEQQRAKCLDCHTAIEHKLIQPDEDGSSDTFVSSFLANCASCHPKHHFAQVDLLLGRGSHGVPKGEPNLMFGSRTNCSGCHNAQVTDGHGGGVAKATEESCRTCHGDRHLETFEKWKLGLELIMEDAVSAYTEARKQLQESSDAPAEAREKATKLLDAAEADLRLVQTGNGLHNVTYAIEVLDSVSSQSQAAMEALTGN